MRVKACRKKALSVAITTSAANARFAPAPAAAPFTAEMVGTGQSKIARSIGTYSSRSVRSISSVAMLPLSPGVTAGEALSLDRLRSALNQPQAYWLRQGLHLRLPGDDQALDDHEPLGPPDALQRHAVRSAAERRPAF